MRILSWLIFLLRLIITLIFHTTVTVILACWLLKVLKTDFSNNL